MRTSMRDVRGHLRRRAVLGRFTRGVPPGDLRAAAIIESTEAPACALDPSGRVVAANRGLHELLGATGHGLRNRSLSSLTYPADVELGRETLVKLFREGLDRDQVDTRSMRLDNRELVWGTWDLSLLRDGRGRPEIALAVVRDRTDIVRSEQERRFFEFLLKIIGEAEDSDAVLSAAVQTICPVSYYTSPSPRDRG
jgi:PAS domain S-box-containing protein